MINVTNLHKMDKQNNRQRIKIISIFVLLICITAYLAVPLNVSVKDCTVFAGYQTFCVFAFGVMLTNLVFSGTLMNPVLFLTASFSAGYAIIIVLYFVTALIHLSEETAGIIAFVTGLVLIALRLRTKRKVKIKALQKMDIPYVVLFFLLLIIVFFAYSANYVVPDETHSSVYYNRDALYWIENAAALKLSFPPQDLRFSGIRMFYHYFASIYIAYSSFLTGIDTFNLGYALYPLTRCMILFGGLYFASQRLIKKESARILFLIAILFSTGIEYNTQARYVSQLLYLPFGFDIAMGYGAYSIAFLCAQLDKQKLEPRLCLCAALTMLLSTGHKAPLALVLMVFAGVLCLSRLLQKDYCYAFTYGSALVAVFLLVMIVCIGFLLPIESSVGVGTFGINANLKYTWMYQWRDGYRLAQASGLKEKLLSIGTELLALGVMLLSFNPLTEFLDLCAIGKWIKKRKCDPIELALLISALFGIFMGSFNYQEGMSHMYYSLAAYLPGLLLGCRNLDSHPKRTGYLCTCVLCLLLCFQLKLYFVDEGVFHNTIDNLRLYMTDGLPRQKENDTDKFEYPINSIQYEEYQAMRWIRENTPKDSIIMPDKDVCKGQPGYMYYATFAERQAYLEGDRYLCDAYQSEREERRLTISHVYLNDMDELERVKQDGVDYIIQTNWIIPTYEGNGCTLVYENSLVKIWRIIK